MASQTTQLIVELLDRVSGPARGVANSLRGITRSVRDATGGRITMADRLDAAITRNNRAIDAARGRMLDAVGTLYVLKTALTAPVQSAQELERALAELGAKGNLSATQLKDIGDAADVGISVAEAVDVARESADIILLTRDLDVLRQGVEDGRRTFANTLKYISITTSANFGNMISMALATPLLPFLPLAAKQILLNNFLSDLPSLAISTDTVDPESVSSPQRWNVRDIRRFMIVFGLISSVFDLLTFGILLYVFNAGEALFQTSWFMISLLTELAVVLVLRTRKPAFRSRPSHLLLLSTLAVAAATLAIPFLGGLSTLFGFVPLSVMELTAVVLIVCGYLAATEAAKAWYFGASSASPPARTANPGGCRQ